MPITLSDLQKDQRTCTVEYAGETCEVTYRPSGYTPEVESEMQDGILGGKPGNGIASMLAGVLIEWEVLDDEGTPLPTDEETLRGLPNAFLVSVLNQITEDMQAGRDDRKNSGGGSLRKASKGSARSGTR